MLTVELKSLGKQAGSAAEFLRSKMKGPVSLRGTQLQFRDVRAHEAKLILHKFLHHRGLDEYRVVVAHPSLVEVLEPKQERPHEPRRRESTPPTPGATMPYFFPSSPALSVPMKKSKAKTARRKN